MAVPKTMRAVEHAANAPLKLVDLPSPEPKPGELLVKVAAAGLNRADLAQRAGFYPPPPGAPPTMGMEFSGEVVAVGPGVRRWKPGDAVAALVAGGGYAEYAVVDEGSALPVPKGLSLIQAAAVPEAAFTVWANVFEAGALQPGETFLVHGGASGIGTTAIQMAKAQGARVFATAGTPEKCALCEELGADRAINYKTEDFEAVVRDLGGADVILDMVGGSYAQRNISAAKPRGRIVIIATMQGMQAEVDLRHIMLKRIVLTGSTLRSRSTEEKARIAAQVEAHVWPWIETGKVKPIIDSTFPLAEAEAAHARMQADLHAGKILLTAA